MGAFGSSALYHLAKQGLKVLGLDPHTPAHPYGSSHGATRITRLAYFEGPQYVPLLRRSYALFAELQDAVKQVRNHPVDGVTDIITSLMCDLYSCTSWSCDGFTGGKGGKERGVDRVQGRLVQPVVSLGALVLTSAIGSSCDAAMGCTTHLVML